VTLNFLLTGSLARPDHIMDVLSAHAKIDDLIAINDMIKKRLEAKEMEKRPSWEPVKKSSSKSTVIDLTDEKEVATRARPSKADAVDIDGDSKENVSDFEEEAKEAPGPKRPVSELTSMPFVRGGLEGVSYPSDKEMFLP